MRKSDIATENITSVALHETAKTRYITYALSVIGSRALPDLRDGMKPVQRRILYGMKEMRLDHDAKYRKSAQVVGSVMGRYHPHGDGAIYDAMVRMAQDFSLRYPLVDGQGNFGSMDGDAAAAMRYTEARLQSLSALMLDDLSENIVDYRPNYDGSLTEPSVLPAVFPNLLVNGSTGIAVGMATNIPPHNLSEILDACTLLLEKPESTPEDVLNIVKGPDFPTGGKIFNTREELREIYATGRGSIDLRGDWHVENADRRQWIVIDEIPYGVNKSKLVTQIADAIVSSKLPLLTNVRDESTDKVRIVTECRPGADPEAVMAYLTKNTELATKFSVNMTCLVPDEASSRLLPDRLGIVDIIKHFLRFRVEVVTRRLREQLELLKNRIHILEAFAKIYGDLDTAIRIIREAEDKNDASEKLCAHFDLDAEQAEAILQTRLYKLAKLEIEKIEAELKAKRAEAAHIVKILESKSALRNVVKSELENVKKNFGDERRTKFGCEVSEKQFNAEDYIISEDVFVFITKEGMIKRQRSYTDLSGVRVRDNDAVKIIVKANTKDALILFTNYGKAYTLPVVNVPQSTGYGMPVQSKFKFDDGESIIASYLSVRGDETKNGGTKNSGPDDGESIDIDNDGLPPCLVPVTASGLIARIPLENFEQNSTVSGRTFLKIKDGDRVVKICFDKPESRYVCLISKKTRASVFRLDEIPLFKGIGKGNKAVAMDKDDEILDCCLASDDGEGLKVTLSGGRVVDINARRIMSCKRGSAGRIISRSDTTLFPEEQVIEII